MSENDLVKRIDNLLATVPRKKPHHVCHKCGCIGGNFYDGSAFDLAPDVPHEELEEDAYQISKTIRGDLNKNLQLLTEQGRSKVLKKKQAQEESFKKVGRGQSDKQKEWQMIIKAVKQKYPDLSQREVLRLASEVRHMD